MNDYSPEGPTAPYPSIQIPLGSGLENDIDPDLSSVAKMEQERRDEAAREQAAQKLLDETVTKKIEQEKRDKAAREQIEQDLDKLRRSIIGERLPKRDIRGSLNPEQRRKNVRFAKRFLIFGLLCAIMFARMLAWHYWAPLHDYLNYNHRPYVIEEPRPGSSLRQFDLMIPPGMKETDFANQEQLNKIADKFKVDDTLPKGVSQGDPSFRKVINLPRDAAGAVLYDRLFLWLRPGEVPRENILYWNINVYLLAAVLLVTYALRVFFPQFFGTDLEPTDALRDWVVAGVGALILFSLLEQLRRAVGLGPIEIEYVNKSWLIYALPLYFLSVAGGYSLAYQCAISQEGLLPAKSRLAGLLVQSALTAILVAVLEGLLEQFVRLPNAFFVMAALSLVLFGFAFAIVFRAWRFDRKLREIQGGNRGVLMPGRPVEINVTLIGGRNSGKSWFLAGVFDQFRFLPGAFKIVADKKSRHESIFNLESMAKTLYQEFEEKRRQADARNLRSADEESGGKGETSGGDREAYIKMGLGGTPDVRVYPFVLTYQPSPSDNPIELAKFTLIDYPGGHITPETLVSRDENGTLADITQEIKELAKTVADRFSKTDAILYVADMSALRQAYARQGNTTRHAQSNQPSDAGRVRNAFGEIRENVLKGSGRDRVVPLAVVRTKCDEFADPKTGQWDEEKIEEFVGSREPQETERTNKDARPASRPSPEWEVLRDWDEDCKAIGPGLAICRSFNTSAITDSVSQDSLGFDSPLDFHPSGSPRATNCLPPVLWLIRETLEQNVTLIADIKAFIIGPSSDIRKKQAAIAALDTLIINPRFIA